MAPAQRRECTQEISRIKDEVHETQERIVRLRAMKEQLKARITCQIDEGMKAKSAIQDNSRVMLYSLKAQDYLSQYSARLLAKHLAMLETLIRDCFHQLVWKESLIGNLSIDPKTFSITFVDTSEREIPAEKLSAGERQLLAIAIFWGLQKASKREIPVVIDTPMGRLDSKHRDVFVKKYLPYAAHQTIVLSTDEEVGARHYHALREYIHSELLISFDPTQASTIVRNGYFV